MTLLCVQVVGSSETMNNLHLHLPLLFVVIVIPIQSPKFGDFESRGGCSIASYTGIRLDYIHEDCKRKTVRVTEPSSQEERDPQFSISISISSYFKYI